MSCPLATVWVTLDSGVDEAQEWVPIAMPTSLMPVQCTVMALKGALVHAGAIAEMAKVQFDSRAIPGLMAQVALPVANTALFGKLEGNARVFGDTVSVDTLPTKGEIFKCDSGVNKKAGEAIKATAARNWIRAVTVTPFTLR